MKIEVNKKEVRILLKSLGIYYIENESIDKLDNESELYNYYQKIKEKRKLE